MTSITIDGTKSGRIFDGVGAISGGGGNAVQLPAYPKQQQSDILDYLFKPGCGAALQILKVEIGGDANSSCGAEPSYQHARGAINSNAGYEWWLMEQAKARNPAIKLYGLAWSAPGWIGGDFWCQDMIDYLVGWLGCAAQHGLSIDYLGGWNENRWDVEWFKDLRRSLDAAGHTATQIVACDKDPYDWTVSSDYNPQYPWCIADQMATDPGLAAAIGVLGAHDVCNKPTDGVQCWSTPKAVASGKPLWHSEVGAMAGTDGAPMIRSVIRGYTDAKMSGHVHWPIITTQPPTQYLDRGLIWAAQPRSGHYIVKAMLGAIGAVTQFTQPGWVHLDSACGYLGGNRANGAYLTLRAPDNSAWTLIAETTTATATQNITVTVKGGLPSGTVHVWRTDPASADRANWLLRRSDYTLDATGSFTFGCLPGYIYTFTSLAPVQGVISPAIPANQSRWPLPYADTWTRDASAAGTMPPLLAPQDGSFEFAHAADGSGSCVVTQTTPQEPIFWCRANPTRFPYAVIGDSSLTDYKVSAAVCFTAPGQSGGLLARWSNQGKDVNNFRGYILDLGSGGGWWLTKNSRTAGHWALAHGTMAKPPAIGVWTQVTMWVHGTTIDAWIGGVHVATVVDDDPHYASGIAGIETDAFRGTWSGTQFRNLSITA